MRLQFEGNERALAATNLGLAANVSNADLAAAIRDRLTGSAASAPAPSRGPAGPAAPPDPACEAVIAAAVREGKFSASRAAHYRAQWASNPEATRRTIARLRPGVVSP